MPSTPYLRPRSIAEVSQCLASFPEAQLLAGGQSLLAAWRLGLCKPTHFVDLQDVPDLNDIRIEGDGDSGGLWVGAMCTHAQIARSPLVLSQNSMLSELAQGIADAQIRNVGSIGGSLANNDPAACWPAGVLAMHASIVTNQREIPADTFFQGLFCTALQHGEWILGVRFPRVAWARYLKFEQAASRFALVGVAVVRSIGGQVRVAISGLGQGVTRWPEAENALTAQWRVNALTPLAFDARAAQTDLHASAHYRAHLVSVLCRRAVAADTRESAAMPASTPVTLATPTSLPVPGRLQGSSLLPATPARVWEQLLNPAVLQRCIPGCTAMTLTKPEHYQAVVKVGLGPVSATFATEVALVTEPHHAPHHPMRCRLVLTGQAGALGAGKATVWVELHAVKDPQTQHINTRLDWQATPELTGKLAQLGNRLMDATAQSLSQQFFKRFSGVLSGETATPNKNKSIYALARTVKQWFQRFFER
jgi:CO/xanthine dehydrogenase FAD-binding subunit/carbon monoxide dehydrogenase subunit G